MVEIAFSFDGKNAVAQRVAAKQAAEMVREVSRETKDAIKMMIAKSIREGIPPYEAARTIKSMVGLTSRQAASTIYYREGLIDRGLTLAKVNSLTDRYVKKKIRERAMTIARYETMNSLNTGTLESWRQAQKKGFLSKDAQKEIIVTPDDRLCDQCAPLDGQTVPLKEKFKYADRGIRAVDNA